MPIYDLFELTGLAFDPVEKAAKKVENALDKAKKELEGLLGSASQMDERPELTGKIAFLGKMKEELFSADKKLTPKLSELAQVKIAEAKKKLERRIRLEELQGKEKVITSAKVKELKKSTKLSESSILEVYAAHGFQIIKVDPLAAYPKFPANAERIYKELAMLRSSHDSNPAKTDPTLVTDLYAFAAYICGEPENAAEYRSMDTSELAKLLDDYAMKNVMRHDDIGKLCVSIANAGKTYVFNSEEDRIAYENHLKYKNPELQELFATLKETSESELHDPTFADACIRIIAGFFDESETALAIYNREAGLQNNPYEQTIPTHLVKCAFCHNLSSFSSRAEAQKKNRCTHCGKQLYKPCPKCKELVLQSADRCPGCYHEFASQRLFDKYLSKAERAVNDGDFVAAQENLVKAETADPSEKTRTGLLRATIDRELIVINEHLKKVNALIGEKKYQAAKDYFTKVIIPNYPGLAGSSKRAEIQRVLSKCTDRFASLDSVSKAQKISICLEILEECADFAPALDFLRSPFAVPDPVPGVDYSVNDEKGIITITWQGSRERSVRYTLVRKEGKIPPKNQNDGVVLCKGSSGLSFSDVSVIPGMSYGYSVFSERMGVFSSARSVTAVVFVKVSDVHFEQHEKSLQITWVAPPQCLGVEVRRTTSGQTRLLSASALHSYVDDNLQYNQMYSYALLAVYGEGKSAAHQFSHMITVEIKPFSISAAPQNDGSYLVSWTIQESGVDLQVLSDQSVIATARSDAQSARVLLAKNGLYTLSVRAFSGGSWISSANTISINTFSSCELNVQACQIYEKTIRKASGVGQKVELELYLKDNIPPQAIGFLFFIRTKPGGKGSPPWVAPQDAMNAADGLWLDVAAYKGNGKAALSMETRNEEAYYITLFTLYMIKGKKILSAPFRRRLPRPLNAELFWRVAQPVLGSQQLQVTIRANRPFSRRPKLLLCASETERLLLSPEDNGASKLMEIPERSLDQPTAELEEQFIISKRIKKKKLFLFETDPVAGEKFSVRWAEGFGGKV